PATQEALSLMYQHREIRDANWMYKERNRPQFHFTVKRGWNNDVNGPIFYRGQYHLFWQSYPYGVKWDTDFMNWGHAISKDMIHWQELAPALRPDKVGAAWSGTGFIDHNNVGGWGKDALVLAYAAYNRISHKQVQCLAYSTDNAKTFTHYAGNPVVDTDSELGTTDTRDPKVFWYEPSNHWVMVLFEKDGMSFFNSSDLKTWTRKSHFKGLHECPDFFELPVDGDSSNKKWVLHGGSSVYFIGSFDGQTFTAESPGLRYAEGKNARGDDVLYAAQSFAEMPDNRRVQMVWGRITEEGMPFNQMILFPTEFKLKTTKDGIRLLATPIQEIELLHAKKYAWSSITAKDANQKLRQIPPGPLHVKLQVALEKKDALTIRYQESPLITIQYGDLENGRGSVELLIDKCVSEIFVDDGMRYITKEMPASTNPHGLECSTGQPDSSLNQLEVYQMKSMWRA
ncbi:MAG: glycoside hydrolase family 32 protein, partial [Acidobacteriaceae bacterium]